MGQLIFFIGMGTSCRWAGIDSLYAAVLASFERMPPGTISPAHAPLDAFVAVLASGFELAFRVSLPVVGIVLLLIVVLGVLGKTIPAFNMMSVGFTFKLMGGIAMLAMGIYARHASLSPWALRMPSTPCSAGVAGMEAPYGRRTWAKSQSCQRQRRLQDVRERGQVAPHPLRRRGPPGGAHGAGGVRRRARPGDGHGDEAAVCRGCVCPDGAHAARHRAGSARGPAWRRSRRSSNHLPRRALVNLGQVGVMVTLQPRRRGWTS